MYCIAGFGKVKSAGEFTAISNHNNRLHLTKNEKSRIDSKRSHLNIVLKNPLDVSKTDAPDLNKKIQNYFASNEISVRSDNVLAVDLMLTASPQFFGEWQKNSALTPAGKQKIEDWYKTQMQFVEKQFGENAVKYAVLHLDETTPHIHFLLTPEETKEVKYKNQYGSGVKKVTSLNADRWNPAFWKKFLKNYEIANKKFNLKKGEEGSMSENVPIKEFMKMVEAASKTDYKKAIENVIDEITEDLSLVNTKAGIQKLLLEKLLPKLNPLMKQNKALKKVLQQDRAKEYASIKKMKDDLEKSLSEAISRKDLYIEAINEKIHMATLLKEQQNEIYALESENIRLKNKYEKTKLDNKDNVNMNRNLKKSSL